jgi:hypothetical protein
MDDFPRRAPVTDQLSPLLENHKGRDSNTSVASEIPLTTPHQPFHFVSWPVGMSFDINYILGVGVLSIPISFYNGGPALGVLFLLFVTVVSYVPLFPWHSLRSLLSSIALTISFIIHFLISFHSLENGVSMVGFSLFFSLFFSLL